MPFFYATLGNMKRNEKMARNKLFSFNSIDLFYDSILEKRWKEGFVTFFGVTLTHYHPAMPFGDRKKN